LSRAGRTVDPILPLLHLPPQPPPEKPSTLRIVEGPHWDRLTVDAHDRLLTAPFTVDVDSSRIGIRLSGPDLVFRSGCSADIVSEPTPVGTVQLPSSGKPIVLMVDRPTTGGYAKIASVVAVDLAVAAQLAPGDPLRFARVSLEEARELYRRREMELKVLDVGSRWLR
jgi:antagonist of KipI